MTSTARAPDIVFRGIDGNECEEFIAAIEELAFTEGWSGDRERMLLFARSRLRHKALRWFARLDPSKKSDWDIFVGEIFDQYPLTDVAPETKIATSIWSAETFIPRPSEATPSSEQAPELQLNLPDDQRIPEDRILQSTLPNLHRYNPSLQGRHFGILRIISDEASAPLQYVSRGLRPIDRISYARLSATTDRQEALLVCFMTSSKPHLIGCLNNECSFRELSLLFHPCNFNSYRLHAGNGVYSPSGVDEERIVSNVWNVLRDGTIQASLSAFDPQSRDSHDRYTYTVKEDFQTTEVHVDTGASIDFVKPGTPLRQDDPKRNGTGGHSEVKARIVFEPL